MWPNSTATGTTEEEQSQPVRRQIDNYRIENHAQKKINPGTHERLRLTEKTPHPIDVPFGAREQQGKRQNKPRENSLKQQATPMVAEAPDAPDQDGRGENVKKREKAYLHGYRPIEHVLSATDGMTTEEEGRADVNGPEDVKKENRYELTGKEQPALRPQGDQ